MKKKGGKGKGDQQKCTHQRRQNWATNECYNAHKMLRQYEVLVHVTVLDSLFRRVRKYNYICRFVALSLPPLLSTR